MICTLAVPTLGLLARRIAASACEDFLYSLKAAASGRAPAYGRRCLYLRPGGAGLTVADLRRRNDESLGHQHADGTRLDGQEHDLDEARFAGGRGSAPHPARASGPWTRSTPTAARSHSPQRGHVTPVTNRCPINRDG